MAYRRIIFVCFILTITFLVTYLLVGYSKYPTLPFKCLTFTRYDLSGGNDNRKLIFNVEQDVRFDKSGAGYLLITGTVDNNGTTTNVKRTLLLADGGAVDRDTFRYKLAKIDKSFTDNTPDSVFNVLLDEIITQSDTLQLDVVSLRKNTMLIGSPVSFLFTCTIY